MPPDYCTRGALACHFSGLNPSLHGAGQVVEVRRRLSAMRFCRVATLLALSLMGCTGNLPVKENHAPRPDPMAEELAYRANLAETQANRGDLAGALLQWQVVLALQPESTQAASRLSSFRKQIERQVDRFHKAARTDLARGQEAAARQALLRALVLKPDDLAIIEDLRTIETRTMQRILTAKADRYEQLAAKPAMVRIEPKPRPEESLQPQAEPGGIDELTYAINEMESTLDGSGGQQAERSRILNFKLRLADLLFNQGRYAESVDTLQSAEMLVAAMPKQRKVLREHAMAVAEGLYGRGVLALAEDRKVAAALWRLALSLDPSHAKAALRMRNLQAATFGGPD